MFVGHQKQWEILKRADETGKLPHAFIFSGQENLGKKKVAFEFISFLFGQDIEKGVHPDFILITATGKEIQISQIRELARRLSLKNFSAPLKAVIIDKADLMNPQAQNCLLKTLEEPRGKTILILVTCRPRTLLPTIISRCQTIKFFPVRESEIKNYLISKGVPKEKIEEIIRICEGRPGQALDLLSEPEKLVKYRKTTSDLIKIFNSSLSFRFQYVKNISEKSKLADPVRSGVSNGADGANGLKEILEIWLGYLRKVLISKINGMPACNPPISLKLWRVADAGKEDAAFQNFSLAKLKNFIEALQETISLISTKNINQRLALENLMLEL